MDTQPAQPQPVVFFNAKNTTPKKPLIIILLIIFLLTVILIVALILNYFNILPLSSLYPKPLGLLPHQTQSLEPDTNQPQQMISVPSVLIIACPVPKEFCNKGKIITYQEKDLGLGFNLPPDTQIFTAFPGIMENGAESGGVFKIKTHPVRWLHGIGQFQGATASYSFFGTPVSSYDASQTIRPFQQQEVMATTSAQTFPTTTPYNGVNIIFSIKKNNELVKFEFKP